MIAALLDHLWQSTALVLAAGLLTLVLRENSAVARYWLWFVASLKFLIPLSLLAALGSATFFQPYAPAFSTPFLYTVEPAAKPFSGAMPVVTVPAPHFDLTPVLMGLWAVGVAVVLAFWFVRSLRLRAALQGARELALGKPMRVMTSVSNLEPGLIGFWRPVLFLPEGIASRLSPPEIEAILTHEFSHLRRYDNITAAIHMLVEALFWFFPPVWWLGARLTEERERACDEAVLKAGNDPQVYAESIIKVCKFYVSSPLACAAGVSGADLRKRVKTILENKLALRLNLIKKCLLCTCAAAAIAAPLVFGLMDSPAAFALAQLPAGPLDAAGRMQLPVLPTAEEIAKTLAEQKASRKAVAFNPALFDKYVGYYQIKPVSFLIVSRKADHFFVRLTGQHDIEIYPESRTKFFARAVPAQISFNSDPAGRITELVLHQGGVEKISPRVDETFAKTIELAVVQHIRNNVPGPGTEAYLRRYIDSLEKEQPNYDDLTPAAARDVRRQAPRLAEFIKKWGLLKTITFKAVDHEGNDVFDVTFEHGQAEWTVAPLTPEGKVWGAAWRWLSVGDLKRRST